MNKYKKQFLFILTAFLLAACAEDLVVVDKPVVVGNLVDVPLSLRCNPIEVIEETENGTNPATTRAPGDIDENNYKNIWVFEFDSDAEDALLVAAPYYVDDAAVQDAKDNNSGVVVVPLIESTDMADIKRLVFVANINDKNYSWNLLPGQHTYADLRSRIITLTHEKQTYGDAAKSLVMSGIALFPIFSSIKVDRDNYSDPAPGTGVGLYRSLARIEFNLKVQAAGYKVISVQLKNVSNRFDLTHKLLGLKTKDAVTPSEETEVYPSLLALRTIDYEKETNENGLILNNGSKKFVWYTPRNTRGISESVNAKTKNTFAPEGATYIEVIARDNLNQGVRYRFYPGANTYNDFNVIPNHNYILNYTIKGDGGDPLNDSRIEQMNNITFSGNNNCFILNPPVDGMAPRKFSVPVTRVNEYWGKNLPGYGGLAGHMLSGSDTWKVELIWQDNPNMVRPIATADPNTQITISKDAGTGGDDVFTITVPSDVEHGNFLVAIKKDGLDKILWSWHLWVTDYNPNPGKTQIEAHKWVYPIEGGELHRLGGAYWGYNSPGATQTNNWNNYEYVGEVSIDAPFAKGFLMDRTLSYHSKQVEPARYQWGRKDPFLLDKTYDINGVLLDGVTALAVWPADNSNSMRNSISEPNRFYKADEDYYTKRDDWSGLYNNSSIWNDGTLPFNQATEQDLRDKTGFFGKSIFDPCPPGWRLPAISPASLSRGVPLGTFYDIRQGVTLSSADRELPARQYWPNFYKNDYYPVEGIIRFNRYQPIRGQAGAKGGIPGGTNGVVMMLGQPYNNSGNNGPMIVGHTYSTYNSMMAVTDLLGKAAAGPARCITDNYCVDFQ